MELKLAEWLAYFRNDNRACKVMLKYGVRVTSVSLLTNTASKVTLVQEVLDIPTAQIFAEHNTELIAISAREAVVDALKTLTDVSLDLNLEDYDCIQFHRGCLDVFRIVNGTKRVNRSVFIELDHYERCLKELKAEDDATRWEYAVTMGLGAIALTVPLYIAYSRNR